MDLSQFVSNPEPKKEIDISKFVSNPDDEDTPIREWLKKQGRENSPITPMIRDRFKRQSEAPKGIGVPKLNLLEQVVSTPVTVAGGIISGIGGEIELGGKVLNRMAQIPGLGIPSDMARPEFVEGSSRFAEKLKETGKDIGKNVGPENKTLNDIAFGTGETLPGLAKYVATAPALGLANFSFWGGIEGLLDAANRGESEAKGFLRGIGKGAIQDFIFKKAHGIVPKDIPRLLNKLAGATATGVGFVGGDIASRGVEDVTGGDKFKLPTLQENIKTFGTGFGTSLLTPGSRPPSEIEQKPVSKPMKLEDTPGPRVIGQGGADVVQKPIVSQEKLPEIGASGGISEPVSIPGEVKTVKNELQKISDGKVDTLSNIFTNPKTAPQTAVAEKLKIKDQVSDAIKQNHFSVDDYVIRYTNSKEAVNIVKNNRMTEGQDFEGNAGISASELGGTAPPAYGSNFEHAAAILIPKKYATGKGVNPGEVLIDPKVPIGELTFIVDGHKGYFKSDRIMDAIGKAEPIKPTDMAAPKPEAAITEPPIPPTMNKKPVPGAVNPVEKMVKPTEIPIDVERKQVADGVVGKIKNLERTILGAEIPGESEISKLIKPTAIGKITGLPGRMQEKLIAEPLNKLADKINKRAEILFGADNDKISTAKYAGKMAKFMHGMFRNFGETRKAKASLEKKQGGMATGTEVGVDFLSAMDDLLVGKSIKKLEGNLSNEIKLDANISRERIHAILDPEMATPKMRTIKESDLAPNEKLYIDHIRAQNDLINDLAYSLDKGNGESYISRENWLKNRGGKYIARMYDFFEEAGDIDIPGKNYETGKLSHAIRGVREDLFKKRGEVDEWKQEHIVRDPAYLTAKRLSQILRLKSMNEYSDVVNRNMKHLVTDNENIARNKHFVKMPPGYGSLSGKWVAERVAEDYRGFKFYNQISDAFYDAFKMYDQMKLRRGMKKMLTVFNPGVRIGNRLMNYSFAFAGGVDPVTHFTNNRWSAKEIDSKGPVYRYAMKRGVLGKNIDMETIFSDLNNVENMRAKNAESLNRRLTKSYQQVDDVSKLSMIKSLMQQGFPIEKAVQHTMRTLQNYNSVGKAFDFGTKVPVFGQAFGKFSANLLSIIKHDITRRPLSTAAFVGMIYGLGQLTSSLANESQEERKLRAAKAFSPGLNIPFLGRIPLTFKVKIGGKEVEVNIARYIMPYYNYTDYQEEGDGVGGFLKEAFDRFSPVTLKRSPDKSVSGGTFQDPLVGPLAQVLIDKDFRGKAISDPNISPYKPTGYSLTGGEQWWNRAKFLARAYMQDSVRQTLDMGNVVITGKDYYGREKTAFQQALRFFGVRAEKMGPEQYSKIKKNISDNLIYRFKQKSTEIKTITNLYAKGKITIGEYKRRVAAVDKERQKIGEELNGTIGNSTKNKSRNLSEFVE